MSDDLQHAGRTQEAFVGFSRGAFLLCGLVLLGALSAPAKAESPIAPTDQVLFGPGLICDTKDQAERFVSLLGDNVEAALGIVNEEAGTPNACMMATMGFVRGGIVSEVLRHATVIDVVEVTVMAVATNLGLQPIEPKKYFSIVRTGDRIA
jgi:hypothetical protein